MIKQANAKQSAAEMRIDDSKVQFYSKLESTFKYTQGLKEAADVYRTAMADANNGELLKKALDRSEERRVGKEC